MNVKFKLEGENSLKEQFVKNGIFKHIHSTKIKLLPYSTTWKRDVYNDFVYFNGIIGECFRLASNKKLTKSLAKEKDYNSKLKETIIKNALERIDGDNERKVKEIIEELIFQEDNLYCFSRETLPYLSFIKDDNGLREIANFIHSIFFTGSIRKAATETKAAKGNILYKLIKNSLPKLQESSSKKKDFFIFNSEIISRFEQDFNLLNKNEESFLKDIEKLIKYYYFYYVSQLGAQLNNFCSEKKFKTYFTLESEIISKSRSAYQRGWESLEGKLSNLFSHVNTLEFLNHIKIGTHSPLSYSQFKNEYVKLEESNKKEVVKHIHDIISFYKDNPSVNPQYGWEECERQLKPKLEKYDCHFEKAIYELWFTVDHQFQNSGRKKYYENYVMWFTQFCKANFLKRRGRLGYTLRLSQDMLLFLTRICIGAEPKIRLKKLWTELELRGVYFDEPTKVEVVRLFEKINLIEKKSDSGDAQYIRAIL